ncbi:MAG: PTS mannitol transporter subunit IICBA [Clostridiales bacterium]|jgi:PTS system mannitol-specific IIC component|nr:PTS mannitol transporter subunit IICBA [Clostridiales bacterium]
MTKRVSWGVNTVRFFAYLKPKIQKLGSHLSGMVMPNIGAFIAWGIITALFIEDGWLPNADLAKLVGPMITYLLPLLIGFTGGRIVYQTRGGVIGAIATMGVIVGADIPMFLGAMVMGPLGGVCIKYIDKLLDGKVKAGFEMLVNNFTAGIVGVVLAVLALLVIGPTVEGLMKWLADLVNIMMKANLIPLANLFIEPAKILFLNNAINHGVLSPIGVGQVAEHGKSIMFLLEANPGPGLGILLAFVFFGKGAARSTSPGAIIIHFLGGIHEIYFPYCLMRPILLLALIGGGIGGSLTFNIFDAGLRAPASPGSIIAILMMTPSDGANIFAVLAGILVATMISFLIAMPFVKTMKLSQDDLTQATKKVSQLKGKQSNLLSNFENNIHNLACNLNVSSIKVSKIVFACDAGMGSSAMGASILKKKIKEANLNIDVSNCSINNLTESADIVITHRDLTERARSKLPATMHISVENFLKSPKYDELVQSLQQQNSELLSVPQSERTSFESKTDKEILKEENILLNQRVTDKFEAISLAGQILVNNGYVNEEYIKFMLEREKLSSTFMGNFLAIPHGTDEAKMTVLQSGISVIIVPSGVDFGEGNIAKIIMGIAGSEGTHLNILSKIAIICSDDSNIKELLMASSQMQILKILEDVQ